MAMNIVSEILSLVTPAALDRIAAALGLGSDATRKALAAAVPALLAVLANKAASPLGAGRLMDAVSQADPDIAGKLSSALTGAKGEQFVESGMGTLASLLDDNTLKGLTGAVAKQVGLRGDAGPSLMAIAGQLVTGALAKTAQGSGLDASGLAALLNSQQGNIKAALPAGLGDLLSSAGVVGSGFAGQAARMATEASRTATAASSQAATAAKKGTNWLMWLIPLIIALAAIWYFMGQGTKPPVTTGTGVTTPAVTDMVVDGVDVGKQMTATLDGLKTALGGITDVATAQAALPKLQATATALDGVTGMLPKLSAAQKTALAALVTAALPAIKEAAAKVLAIQGVGDVAKPAIDTVMAKLESLATAT